jgi:cytochrome c biogenesis protein CcmG, thiol:disulfide interchange protein DsbE
MMAVKRGVAVRCIAIFLGLTTLAEPTRCLRTSPVAVRATIVGLVIGPDRQCRNALGELCQCALARFAVGQGR